MGLRWLELGSISLGLCACGSVTSKEDTGTASTSTAVASSPLGSSATATATTSISATGTTTAIPTTTTIANATSTSGTTATTALTTTAMTTTSTTTLTITTEASTSSTSGSSATTGDVATPANWVFLASSTADEIRAFDIANVAAGPSFVTAPEAEYPYDLTLTPDGSELWVVGQVGDGFVVVATENPGVVHTGVLTADFPTNVTFDGDTAYVSSALTNAIVLVDRATYGEIDVIATPDERSPGKGTFDPCRPRLHLVEWGGPTLMTYDTAQGQWSTLPLQAGSQLWDLVVAPSGDRMYVIDRGLAAVHVLELADGLPVGPPLASLDVSADPWALDLTSDGQTLVVVCDEGDAVHLIDTQDLTDITIPLPEDAEAHSVDITADDALAWVATGTIANDDGAFVIDLATASLQNTIGIGPDNTSLVAVAPQASTCLPTP